MKNQHKHETMNDKPWQLVEVNKSLLLTGINLPVYILINFIVKRAFFFSFHHSKEGSCIFLNGVFQSPRCKT